MANSEFYERMKKKYLGAISSETDTDGGDGSYYEQMHRKYGPSSADEWMAGGSDLIRELQTGNRSADITRRVRSWMDEADRWRGELTGNYSALSQIEKQIKRVSDAFRADPVAVQRTAEIPAAPVVAPGVTQQEKRKAMDMAMQRLLTGTGDTSSQRQQETSMLNLNNVYGQKYEKMSAKDQMAAVERLGSANDEQSGKELQWLYENGAPAVQAAGRQKKYRDNAQRVAELKAELERLGSLGNSPWTAQQKEKLRQEIAALAAENRRYERGEGGTGVKASDEVFSLMLQDDFGTVAAQRDYGNPSPEEYDAWYTAQYGGQRIDPATGKVVEVAAPVTYKDGGEAPKVSDRVGFYLQMVNGGYSMGANAVGDDYHKLMAEGEAGSWKYLNEDELSSYYYLRNTQGEAAADAFLKSMQTELNRRQTLDEQQQYLDRYTAASGWGKLGMNLATTQANVMGAPVALADDLTHMVRGEEINPYSPAHKGMHYSQTVRSETAHNIDEALPWAKIPGIDFSAGDLYQTGMSMLDSWASIGIGGKLGGVLLATNAATSEAARLWQEGASSGQIAAGSALAGAAELVFESIGIEKLMNIKDVDTLRGLIVNVLKQGATEGLEEGGTEIANILTNALVMRSESDWAKLVEASGGDTWKAFLSEVQAVAKASVGGFFSGAGMGGMKAGVSYIGNQIQQNGAYRDTGRQLIQEGGVDPLKALANEMYGVMEGNAQRKLGKQAAKVEKKATPLRVGKLAALVDENMPAYQEAQAERTRSALVEKMTEKGVDTAQAETVADAIATAQAGKELTAQQLETLISLPDADDRVIAAIDEVGEQLIQSNKQNAAEQVAVDAPQETFARDTVEIEDLPSAEGKVLYKGNPVELGDVVEAGGGKLTVQLQDGKKVDAAELSFPEQGEQELYAAVAKYANSAEDARQLLENYRSGDASAQVYARAIGEAYQYGRLQYTPQQVVQEGVLTGRLNNEQLTYAYDLGKASMERDTTRRQQEVARKSAPRKGGVHYGYKGEQLDKSRLNEAQKVVVDFAERLAAKKGMTFYFYRSHVNAQGQRVYKNADGQEVRAGNGYYDPRDGSIHIDLNAGNAGSAMLSTIAHELTHFIQDWSPVKYRTLCRILMEGYADRGQSVRELVLAKQEQYRQELGIELTYEQAYDEVIASSMESVLNDGNVMDLLDEIERTDKTLWEKFRSFLEEILTVLSRTIEAFRGVHPESPEGRILERMTEIHGQLELAFTEGLHEGGENYREGGQKNTAQEGGVRHAYSKPAYDRWEVETALLDAMDHTDAGDDNLIRIGNMPKFVVNLLGIEGEFYIYRDHAYENMNSQESAQQDNRKTERKGKKVHFHNIGFDKMADAIMELENPIMTIEDGTEYGNPEIVMVLPVVGQNGAPLYAALSFYSNKPINGKFEKKPHIVLTVSERNLYAEGGRDGYVEVINKAIGEGRLISYDKEKMSTYLSVIANHTRVGNVTSSMLDKNLSHVRQKVKDFKERNKIKYSARYQQNEAAAELLQKENERLNRDVAELTPLVQALRKMNGGKIKNAYLAEAVAHLLRTAGAKGNRAEFGKLLGDFYSYVTHNNDYTWEDIRDRALPVAQWLMDHQIRTRQQSEYAKDILKFLRTSRVYLDDTQKAEAAYRYGSYDAYRRMAMGSVIFTNERSVSLDTKWQELSELYPDVFDPDTNAADMPEALLDVIQRLRTSDTTELEYEYSRDMIEQDLILRIYDSFWNASTLNVAADYFGQKIRSLKEGHKRTMGIIRQRHQDAVDSLHQKYQKRIDALQAHHEERYQLREAAYTASRKNAVERHDKAQMRKRIRKEVESLCRLNERAPKDKRTKEELQEFSRSAVRVADAVFLENYNEYEMIRKGVGVELLPEEAQLMEECRQLLEQLGDVKPVEDQWDLEDTLRYAKENAAIKEQLFKKIKPLRDAGIFRREFNRIHNIDASALINELITSYEQLKLTESDYLSGAYQEEVYNQLKKVKDSIGAKAVKDMSLSELEQLYEIYHMVVHVVQTANETFAGERAKSITALGGSVVRELEGRKTHTTSRKVIEDLKQAGWDGLTVAYAFRTIGSPTMLQLYKNLRDGEDVWARDMQEAKDFWQKQAEKYKAHDWDMDKRQQFHDGRGNAFSISLGQLMSLYALSKRKQAWDHLEVGGFMLDNSEHYIENIVDRALPKVSTSAQTYKLTRKDLDAICSKLTAEQRAFVDATQGYLSRELAEKGNEVSMKLYGIKLFKEQNYFPLRTASQGRYQSTELVDQNKLKNSGFTKEIKPKASNAVVLSGYSSVWTGHVNQMGLYHGLTLPMEDMDRVLNFGKTIQRDENGNDTEVFEQDSVCAKMQNIFGQHPENYIRALMKQLNGGVRTDETEKISGRMMGRFKKAAVAASLSVWIQQWTSMFRAMAYIDPRFFAQMPKLGKQRQTQVEDMKAHCPVAIIKEMGGFDTGMGASVHDFITGRDPKGMKDWGQELLKHPIKKMDELSGWLPGRADENTWVRIWIAAKRETLDKHKDLKAGSEEFYKLAADRFNEVITLTQVYDSVMAKSALMRSKGFGAKMLTQFMAEPTIASNMAWDAGLQTARTGKAQLKTAGALVTSVVVNAMCSSLIYAMRDDDEEETFLEKYAQSLVSNLADGLNPLTYIPIVRDIWSLAQGYDVGRSDMELWAGLSSALQKIAKQYANENATAKDIRNAWWSLADNVFSLFGIPEKNVRREINAVGNVFRTLRTDFEGRATTGGSIADSMQDAFLSSVPIVGMIGRESKAEKLLDACIAGDTRYAQRLRNTYKTEADANNAVAAVIGERFTDGELTAKAAAEQLVAYAGKSEEEAADKLTYWQFRLEHHESKLIESQALQWEAVKDTGISLEVFTQYKGLCTGKTKREEILPIIDSLPLSVKQKDALYFQKGYAESTLVEAPWH